MAESVDQEIEAIKAVLAALAPLSEKARSSVLEYVTKRLDLAQRLAPLSEALPAAAPSGPRQGAAVQPSATPLHIEQFKQQKRPRSANEMAAVVAYYLANLAPPDQRKATVNQKDIETYFKIASFPLSHHPRATLPNAKNAGYFDLTGDGEYKLNAVGHNLVAHSMPRGASKTGPTTAPRVRPKRRSGPSTKAR